MIPTLRCFLRPFLQGVVPLQTAEQRANEEEVVEKTTTQMYRAPELVDLYLERELTEKVDVWVSQKVRERVGEAASLLTSERGGNGLVPPFPI